MDDEQSPIDKELKTLFEDYSIDSQSHGNIVFLVNIKYNKIKITHKYTNTHTHKLAEKNIILRIF